MSVNGVNYNANREQAIAALETDYRFTTKHYPDGYRYNERVEENRLLAKKIRV